MQRVNDDEAVLQRMAAGESGALNELYARHRTPLPACLRELVDDPGLAEEVFQDTVEFNRIVLAFLAFPGIDATPTL